MWGTPTTISGDTDISTTGTSVYALNLTGGAATVNTVVFTNVTSINGNANVTTTKYNSPNASYGEGGSGTAYFGLSADYQKLLTGAHYAQTTISAGAATITLNNLTINQVYQVQIWLNDSRDNGDLSSTITGGPTLDYNNSNALGGVGQFVLGTFTADVITQSFDLNTDNADPTRNRQLNAIQLRAIPEPNSLALLGGLLALGLFGRHRGA